MSITTKPYGKDHHGNSVTQYTMTNATGASVSILDFGGVITQIIVPDRHGKLADVNLGFEDATAYTADSGSMGALIGRVGNRISGAKFELEGKTYPLDANCGKHTLHGGFDNFSVRMWKAEPEEGKEIDTLKLTLTSPDGDHGFPGELAVTVRYTFDDQNRLGIEYRANTNKTTVVNMTNHAYFNLDGHDAPSVEELELQIFADYVGDVDEALIPTGKLIPQKSVAYDFSSPRRVGDVLSHTHIDPDMKAAMGVDFNYCAGNDRQQKLIAILYSPKTGREMRTYTDQPGVQIYTGQGLHQKGKGGVQYHAYSGICLETQHYPDAVHQPQYPSIVLRPEETYFTKTIYAFGVR